MARSLYRRYLGPALLILSAVVFAGASAPARAASPTSPPSAPIVTSSDVRNLLLPQPPSSPSPVPAAAPLARWAYMVGSAIPDSLRQHAGQIDYLSPAWFHMDANGNISGHDSPEVTQFARANGIKIVPIVANGSFEGTVSHALVTDGNRQTRGLDSLQQLLTTYGYDGVNIDFENVSPADRQGFSAMMTNVYARLHPLGKLVTISLPSKTHETTTGFSGAFDYAGLAPNVDMAILMAYDQHYSGGSAGPIAELGWVDQVVQYAKSRIPANKLLLGMALYGYDWNLAGGGGRAMTYAQTVSAVFAHGGQIQMNRSSASPSYTYDGGNGVHQVWFENSTSLSSKVDLASANGLAGWGVWRLGQEDPNFWTLALANRPFLARTFPVPH